MSLVVLLGFRPTFSPAHPDPANSSVCGKFIAFVRRICSDCVANPVRLRSRGASGLFPSATRPPPTLQCAWRREHSNCMSACAQHVACIVSARRHVKGTPQLSYPPALCHVARVMCALVFRGGPSRLLRLPMRYGCCVRPAPLPVLLQPQPLAAPRALLDYGPRLPTPPRRSWVPCSRSCCCFPWYRQGCVRCARRRPACGGAAADAAPQTTAAWARKELQGCWRRQ